ASGRIFLWGRQHAMGAGAHWRGRDRAVAANTSRPLGKLRTTLRPLGNAAAQRSGRYHLLARVSLLNESRSRLDLENLLGDDGGVTLPRARFADATCGRAHIFPLRRDGAAKSHFVLWRARNHCVCFGGVGVCADAAALVSRPSGSQKAAASND